MPADAPVAMRDPKPVQVRRLYGCMLSDVGRGRSANEDRARYVIPRQPDPRAALGILAVVADGMGGHAAGEIASSIASEVVVHDYYARGGDRHAALRDAFLAAN